MEDITDMKLKDKVKRKVRTRQLVDRKSTVTKLEAVVKQIMPEIRNGQGNQEQRDRHEDHQPPDTGQFNFPSMSTISSPSSSVVGSRRASQAISDLDILEEVASIVVEGEVR